LWDGEGSPVLVDPAVYRGHREVDLAMMELFGGFSRRAFDAYLDRWPLAPGYPDRRKHAYQLYPLLVHLALFGESYLPGVRDCVRQLAEVIS
jgi:fructosamine-3-kinase